MKTIFKSCSFHSPGRSTRATLVLAGAAAAMASLPGAQAAGTAAPARLAIPGAHTYPESLTSTADGRVIIGSLGTGQIFNVPAGSAEAKPWIAGDSASGLGVLGVFADERAHTLWACYTSIPGDKTKQSPSVLKAFDLVSGKPKGSYRLPTAGAVCNDIATGSDGSVYLTDTQNMEIDRLKAGDTALHPWAANGQFGPTGGVLDGISILGQTLVVNTLTTNKVFTVTIGADGSAGAAKEMKLDRAIDQPDGMRAFGKDSVLLIESGGKGRLALLKLQDGSGHLTTLKEGYPGGPVSVSVVGSTAYVLEGQLVGLFGPKASSYKPTPFQATAVEVTRP